jgi:hypothetical protein
VESARSSPRFPVYSAAPLRMPRPDCIAFPQNRLANAAGTRLAAARAGKITDVGTVALARADPPS